MGEDAAGLYWVEANSLQCTGWSHIKKDLSGPTCQWCWLGLRSLAEIMEPVRKPAMLGSLRELQTEWGGVGAAHTGMGRGPQDVSEGGGCGTGEGSRRNGTTKN